MDDYLDINGVRYVRETDTTPPSADIVEVTTDVQDDYIYIYPPTDNVYDRERKDYYLSFESNRDFRPMLTGGCTPDVRVRPVARIKVEKLKEEE